MKKYIITLLVSPLLLFSSINTLQAYNQNKILPRIYTLNISTYKGNNCLFSNLLLVFHNSFPSLEYEDCRKDIKSNLHINLFKDAYSNFEITIEISYLNSNGERETINKVLGVTNKELFSLLGNNIDQVNNLLSRKHFTKENSITITPTFLNTNKDINIKILKDGDSVYESSLSSFLQFDNNYQYYNFYNNETNEFLIGSKVNISNIKLPKEKNKVILTSSNKDDKVYLSSLGRNPLDSTIYQSLIYLDDQDETSQKFSKKITIYKITNSDEIFSKNLDVLILEKDHTINYSKVKSYIFSENDNIDITDSLLEDGIYILEQEVKDNRSGEITPYLIEVDKGQRYLRRVGGNNNLYNTNTLEGNKLGSIKLLGEVSEEVSFGHKELLTSENPLVHIQVEKPTTSLTTEKEFLEPGETTTIYLEGNFFHKGLFPYFSENDSSLSTFNLDLLLDNKLEVVDVDSKAISLPYDMGGVNIFKPKNKSTISIKTTNGNSKDVNLDTYITKKSLEEVNRQQENYNQDFYFGRRGNPYSKYNYYSIGDYYLEDIETILPENFDSGEKVNSLDYGSVNYMRPYKEIYNSELVNSSNNRYKSIGFYKGGTPLYYKIKIPLTIKNISTERVQVNGEISVRKNYPQIIYLSQYEDFRGGCRYNREEFQNKGEQDNFSLSFYSISSYKKAELLNTKPTISIKGLDNIYYSENLEEQITVGDSFIDEGKFIDKEDGEGVIKSKKIFKFNTEKGLSSTMLDSEIFTKVNTIDTRKPGKYLLEYWYKDKGGLVSDTLSRTLTIKERPNEKNFNRN